MNKQSIIFLVLILIGDMAYGCSSPPKYYFYSPIELVSNSSLIVLAKAKTKKGIESKYRKFPIFESVKFDVIEVLKGDPEISSVEMKGYISKKTPYDFGNHELKEFWDQPMLGAGIAPGDCYAYGLYDIEGVYLLFTDVGHIKSFERIQDLDADLWLTHVRGLTE